VGEIVAGIHCGEQFAAAGAQKDEASVADLRRRPGAAEGGNRDGHGESRSMTGYTTGPANQVTSGWNYFG
jgi:hypothetical protein